MSLGFHYFLYTVLYTVSTTAPVGNGGVGYLSELHKDAKRFARASDGIIEH